MNIQVEVEKFTDISMLREANEFTSDISSTMGLALAYHMEHSPIRTQMFKIKIYEIFTKVSVHLVRHSAVGQLHFVKTNREDRQWEDADQFDYQVHRLTRINHLMILNAQHLIDMSRKRLCKASDKHTVKTMQVIKDEIKRIDPALARYMTPNCIYRGGECYEGKFSCGMKPLAELRTVEYDLTGEQV